MLNILDYQIKIYHIKKVLIAGIRTTAKNTTRYPAKNGISPFAISPILSLDTLAAEKILTATGGVIVPITLDIQTIIPK